MTATGMPLQMSVRGDVRGGNIASKGHWLYPDKPTPGESNSTFVKDLLSRQMKRFAPLNGLQLLDLMGSEKPMRLGPSRCLQELQSEGIPLATVADTQ